MAFRKRAKNQMFMGVTTSYFMLQNMELYHQVHHQKTKKLQTIRFLYNVKEITHHLTIAGMVVLLG